ncbi:FISUMP domain-containing protein [Pedobacter panaciterrae]
MDNIDNILKWQILSRGPLKDLLYWSTPNVGATNSSGFSALPGGYRFAHGNFDNLSLIGYYWASTEDSGVSGGVVSDEIRLYHSYIEVDISSGFKYNGYSVRCVKD